MKSFATLVSAFALILLPALHVSASADDADPNLQQARKKRQELRESKRQEKREARKEAQAGRKEARKEARETRKETRKAAHQERKEARKDAHQQRKQARQESREARKKAALAGAGGAQAEEIKDETLEETEDF